MNFRAFDGNSVKPVGNAPVSAAVLKKKVK
jgi:hypothetical protein